MRFLGDGFLFFCDVISIVKDKRNDILKINCCTYSIIVWATGKSFQHGYVDLDIEGVVECLFLS